MSPEDGAPQHRHRTRAGGSRGRPWSSATQISQRPGLAQRTFFRHFTDKREVLFGGAGLLQDLLVDGVLSAPSSVAPLEAVTEALATAGDVFPAERALSRQRQRIIAANPELQERERTKLTSLAAALADALCQRGVPDRAAGLAADVGMAVVRAAFERWMTEPEQVDSGRLVREPLEELRAVTSGGRS